MCGGEVVEDGALAFSYEALKQAPAYHLRLLGSPPAFVSLADMRLKVTRAKWRLTMLELSSEILDSPKAVTDNSLAADSFRKLEDTLALWQAVISNFFSVMDFRARSLTDRLFSYDVRRPSATPLPLCIRDQRGAPPVAVWLAPMPAKEAGRGKARSVRPRRRGEGPSASS